MQKLILIIFFICISQSVLYSNEKAYFLMLKDKIVFKKNSKFSKPLIKLEKGRLVIVKKCIENWCNIKTEKYKGWIKVNNVWGKN